MIKEFEFDHRSLEEEAMTEKYYIDALGNERLSQVVDRAKLNKLARERNHKGREIMEPFRSWCVTYKALAPSNADRKAGMVYVAIWETYNRPWEKLLRTDIDEFRKNDLRRGLALFGEWLSLTGPTGDDKEWGRRILSNTARLKASGGRQVTLPKEKRLTKRLDPLTQDEWKAIFEAIEKWHKTRGASAPWARSFFRLKFKLGLQHITLAGLYYLKRDDVEEALHDISAGKRGVVIKLWTSSTLARLIPAKLVEKELQTLRDFPAAWGIFADLIAPLTEKEDSRVLQASRVVTRTWRDIVKHSDGLVRNDVAWYKQARLAAIREAWTKTQDKILLQSLFGHTRKWFNGQEFLR